ncbi:MAG: hypothetical protein JO284_17790 [Planctomycetaceae bacterium]|nr:hypothetical protein [Planctomycetaceae bacterium]MBV8318488.1 hypothetical protein [Planctomycetaceae bacterium]MBV8382679.1 hypothetical protein [Planctomycetaceae bacterium]MBV8606206.1 hypothetical protein [Singulisphaera sp.]
MHSEAYHRAREIAIEEAELGLAPEGEGWPAWTDEVRYAVTEADEREARDFFKDTAVEAFEEFVCGLPDTDFVEVSRAIRTLRHAVLRYNAEKDEWEEPIGMTDLLELF